MGDFNFPNISWEDLTIQQNKTKDQTLQCNMLFNFMSENLTSQLVLEPTRKDNILDLLLSNNDRIFSQIKTYDTALSDHKLIKADLLYNPMVRRTKLCPPNFIPFTFRSIDLHKSNYDIINEELDVVDWEALQQLLTAAVVFRPSVDRKLEPARPLSGAAEQVECLISF